MEKENGESSVADAIGGNGNSSKSDTSLLDAASLFGAYWGRDSSSQATAASLLGGGTGFPGAGGSAMSGFGLLGSGGGTPGPTSGRYPPNSTLSVAASQAASLGLHPAASAAWWSMASQLAAQDYLARLQASGLAAFPPDPYAAALGALGGSSSNSRNSSSRSPRAPRTPSHRSHNKDKNSVNSNSSSQNQSNSQNNLRSSYGLPKTSSPSLSNAQNMSMTSSLSALGLNSLAGSHSKATTHSTSSTTSSSNKHSRKSSSSAAAKASALSGAYLAQGVGGGSGSTKSSGGSLKDKELALLRGDLIMAQAAMAQNAYQAAVAAAASSHKGGKNSLFNNPFALGSLSNNSSSDKDRHSNLDSIANLPHTILSAALEGSDNSSILGGVRLPPDTEIIKYTSSIVGPKVRKVPGTTNRGRKKTISLDPPHVSVLPALSSTGLLVERGGPAKRPKLESDYGSLPMAHQNSSTPTSGTNSSNNDRVEVIKLPTGSNSQNSPFNSSSYTGLNLSSKSSSSPQLPTDLSHREASPASTINDEDAPLNLSLKSSTNQSENDWKSNNSLNQSHDESANSLNSLSNITAKLGARTAPPPPDRVSRRKPGAKPRRVIQDTVIQSSVSPQRNTSPSLSHRDKDGNSSGLSHLVGTPLASESPGPKSSGSEDNDVGPWHSNKEGRPRNLGRGVSKPKKNTVASLLAQSRALGIRPALAHQYLQEAADLVKLNPELQEKLKAAMNDPSSLIEMSESESEGPWESCPSDTEGSDAFGSRNRSFSDHTHLRIPLSLGWKRETLIKGLSRSGGIKGDVVYHPPEPQASLKIKSAQELASYLEKNPCPPLTKDNFSFSSRPLVGSFLQVSSTFGIPGSETEVLKMSETEVAKRLDEAKRALGSLAGSTLAVEQRIELARQQQAAREARKDAVKGREQARLAREQERTEKAEQAKRDREARSQQIMEARRKRQEELEKQRHEDQTRKQQERELKRQQALMLKEQERERRRQHMALIKQLDCRRRFEEREKRKHQVLLDKLLLKEKRLEERKKEIELLTELRKPQEDTTLSDQKPLPSYNRIPGLKLSGQAMADILMVFEFLHNFGQTLGFDMETLPSLNTLQMALLPDCCVDAEEELISVMTHLLACAIEDPGIPHPGRHTTILGQTLRTNEITPANISELLRIYLYAHATGEVKALTGINPERDREKRIADHHQNDSDALQQSCHGRNLQYYRHLHSRPAWKLAEKLRLRPYAALDPTTKANILARLCDNLLQSKPILRQIDASLENLNHLRKERYLMDTKLRKLKVMHSRKVRMENAEKQQALALERMQRMVEENENAQNALKEKLSMDKENDTTNIEASEEKNDAFYSELNDNFSKKSTEETIIDNNEIDDNIEKQTEPIHAIDSPQHDLVNSINDSILIAAPAPYMKDQEKEGLMEIAKANGTASIVNKDVHITDKDSVMGDSELILSDVESEGTQPEEDEDKNLPAEELSKKLERLIKQSDVQLQNLISGSHALRATCYGQDRFWRRYWSLSKCGGVFVESMESAQPEIMDYHERMELNAKRKEEEEANSKLQKRKKKRGSKSDKNKSSDGTDESDGSKVDDQLSDLELQNIKNELNLSDHTRIIKYESNVQMGDGKVEGSPIKMEEKFIQQQKLTEDGSLDIEDSIPTAFLVQKPQIGKNLFNSTSSQPENDIKCENSLQIKSEDLKPDIAHSVESENKENIETEVADSVNIKKEDSSSMNNLEELKKIAESVIQPWETKENDIKPSEESIKEQKDEEKDDADDPEKADALLNTKMSEGKWFSILRREMPVLISDNPHLNEDDHPQDKEPNIQKPIDIANANNYKGTFVNLAFCDNSATCSEILLTQGNRWEVINNLNLLSNPNTLFSNINGIHNMQPISTTCYHADSSLTMSGLDQEMLDSSMTDKPNSVVESEILENCNKEESSMEIAFKDNVNESVDENDCKSEQMKMKLLSNNLNCINSIVNLNQSFVPNFSNVNLPALTAYVSCDSPAPLQMTPEESEQLEHCKINGLPKKLDGNYVAKDMRYGWWRITDVDQLQETLEKIHPRGVRERELHNSFILSLQQTSGKLHIEKGDITATELSISHLDRVIAQNGGFPLPDNQDSISVKTCRRIEMSLLEQVEALEDRVAAASMQVKGWKPGMRPDDTNIELDEEEDAIELARERLLSLEAAIERRYLRPPLGAGSLPAPAPSSMNTSNSSPVSSAPNETSTGGDTPVGSRPSSPAHNHTDNASDTKVVGIPRGLATWREAVARCQTTSQLAMVLHALESAIAWDKSIMKANCQFCQSGDSEDKLLLCDGCDKGYHTYCFKPKMDKIPDGDWYCFECLNKATGEKVCIVCGGRSIMSGGVMVPVAKGRLIPCAICPRAYHQDCHYPPMTKFPRGKWYCVNCISKAPPKKPRNKKSSKNSSSADITQDNIQPPSPAASQASTATTIEDCPITMSQFCQSSLSSVQSTPEKHFQNNHSQMNTFSTPDNVKSFNNSVANSPVHVMDAPSKSGTRDLTEYMEKEASNKDFIDSDDVNMPENSAMNIDEHNFTDNALEDFAIENNQEVDHKNSSSNYEKNNEESSNMDTEISYSVLENDSNSGHNNEEYNSKGNSKRHDKDNDIPSSPVRDREAKHSCNKKDRNSIKRLNKELAPCKALLEEMESHDDSWPFLLPVNTKQFPTYKKVIRSPMDLSTIKRKLQDLSYKSKEEFASDVRQIFHNCEVFNEDESPVGQAGHGMRRFFEEKWSTV